jgi:aromatic-L-amino-acid decarboxylase
MDYGIQLGRRFRALKAWVIFRSFGREGMAARLREFVRLANVLAGWIKTDDRFELVAPVSMGVVCFRFIGSDGPPGRPSAAARSRGEQAVVAPYRVDRPNDSKIDQLNSEIVEQINASGRAYLTQTKLAGRTVMRIGLGNVLTTEEHLRKAWEMIQQTASAL